jgi:multidrug resistance efflux pump
MVSKGEMIRQMPVTNAYRLILDHILKLRVTVPEKFKPEVRIGQRVAVRVEAYPNRTFSGAVSRTIVPSPGAEMIVISPPISAARSRMAARPNECGFAVD